MRHALATSLFGAVLCLSACVQTSAVAEALDGEACLEASDCAGSQMCVRTSIEIDNDLPGRCSSSSECEPDDQFGCQCTVDVGSECGTDQLYDAFGRPNIKGICVMDESQIVFCAVDENAETGGEIEDEFGEI